MAVGGSLVRQVWSNGRGSVSNVVIRMQGCLVWGALHVRAHSLLVTLPYRWEGGSLGGWAGGGVGGCRGWVGDLGGWHPDGRVGGLRVGVWAEKQAF